MQNTKSKLNELVLEQINMLGVQVEWDPRNKESKIESLVINKIEFPILVIYSKEISSGKSKPNSYSEENDEFDFQIKQEFDVNKFNFNSSQSKGHAIIEVAADDYILINVYPVIQNSLLLLPKMNMNKPQFIDSAELLYTCVLLTKENCFEFNNNHIVVGYNSKGACSSINHLHFQIFFFDSIEYEPWLSYRKSSTIFMEGFRRLKAGISNQETSVDDCNEKDKIYSFQEQKSDEFQDCKVYIAKFAVSSHEDIAFIIIDYTDASDNSHLFHNSIPIHPDSFSPELKSISASIFNIIKRLNHQNTPYNIIFQKGHAIIVPRKPDKICEDIFFGILEFMHIYSCYSEKEFLEFSSETYIKGLKIYLYSSLSIQKLISQ